MGISGFNVLSEFSTFFFSASDKFGKVIENKNAMTFETLGLKQPLLDAITELGFNTPTEIQQKSIPVFLRRERDLVALAQTGTGKTASFGLPILHHLNTSQKNVQALIISPTRELCLQITNDLKNYSKYIPGVRITAVYGGSSIVVQIKEIRQGAQIIVATPGRLIDLLERKAVRLDAVQTVVLDEADEMLNMGFQEDMETILAQTPADKITGLFSATMPTEIRRIANNYLREHDEVASGKKNAASRDISHQYAVVHAKDKQAALRRIIDFNDDFFGIVFCTTKIETQEISDALVKSGYNADCLHGDLSQQQRDKVMGRFRKRAVRILCATDVAARGIDVNDITHVIHYHLPDDIENYTHRSGRTARAGKKGISIALLHIREAYKLHQIEKMAGVKFEKFIIPSGSSILEKRVQRVVEKYSQAEETETPEINDEWITPLMQLEKETLVRILLQQELQGINWAAIQEDLNVDETKPKRKSETSGSGKPYAGSNSGKGSGDSTRLFINLGKKDNIRYDEMRELIFKASKVSGHAIKDIQMKGVYSFFETDARSAERILNGFKNVQAFGRSVRIERTEDSYTKKSFRVNDESRGSSRTKFKKEYSSGRKKQNPAKGF